jgi:hypothetical protein
MDPRLATAYAVTLLAGYLMMIAGVNKKRLAWRPQRRPRPKRRIGARLPRFRRRRTVA